MTKRIILIFILVAMLFIYTACNSTVQNPLANNPDNIEQITKNDSKPVVKIEQVDSPIVVEDNVIYVSNGLDKLKGYYNINDLDAASELVFSGECISTESVFQNDMLYTLSKVKVAKVFKGKISKDDVLLFIEYGGRVTNGEYTKGTHIADKEFLKDVPKMPDDQQLVIGVDGFFPFRQGEKVLLFAQDVSGFLETVDEPLYGITGGWDGKLFKQNDESYAKPIASNTDKHIFGKESLIINNGDLNTQYK